MVAAATLAVGAMSAASSVAASSMNKPSKSSGATTSTPWAPQATALQDLYGTAKDAYQNRQASGAYESPLYAGLNDTQTGAATTAGNYSAGTGGNLANGTATTAQLLQGAAPNYVANAQSLASGGAGPSDPAMRGVLSGYAAGTTPIAGVNPTLAAALSTAASHGATSINNFNTGLTQVARAATADPTASLVGNAQTYANSGYARDLMNTTNADIRNTLGQTNAASDVHAANVGALNSSRAGMVEAQNNRNAALLIANSDATIGNNAFNSGLATAAQQHTSGQNTAVTANLGGITSNNGVAQTTAALHQNAGQFGATTSLDAAKVGLSSDLGARTLDAGTRLAGNAQLGSATNTGLTGALDANQMAAQNYALSQQAGGLHQNDQNAKLADKYALWQRQTGTGQSNLNDYARIVTQGYNGSNATSSSGTETPASNYAAMALGGAAAGVGLYQNFAGNGGNARPDPMSFGVNSTPEARAQAQQGLYSGLTPIY